MKIFYIVVLTFVLVRSIDFEFTMPNYPNLAFSQQELYMDQRLTHFDISDDRKWKQRYFKADLQQQSGDSRNVLIYICGEGPCSGIPKSRTFPIRIAQELEMSVYALEHRFYGRSQPFLNQQNSNTVEMDNSLLSVDNLKYLTVEQAIEDLAYFIMFLKESGDISNDSQIMVVGGSYPGALSAWFSQKYGHLLKLAYSSSGVIKIIEDFQQFDQTIYNVLEQYDQQNQDNCVKRVQLHIQQIATMKQSELELLIKDNMGEQFVLSELVDMHWMLSDIIAETVQYSHKTQFCRNLAKVKQIDQFFQLLKKLGELLGTKDGKDYDTKFLKNSFYDINNQRSSRQWLYQTCTQLGWFQTPFYTVQLQNNNYSRLHSLLFDIAKPKQHQKNVQMRFDSLTMDYYNSLCKTAFGFGIQHTEIKNCQNRYAGESIQNPNIIFVNAQDDPWKSAGLLANTQYQKRVHYVECKGDCGHCIDLGTFVEGQDQGITQVQQQVLQEIRSIYQSHQ